MIDIFAKPLGLLLKVIYDFCSEIGLDGDYMSAYAMSIILTTIIFKLILLPLTIKQTKSMENMQVIQPKVQEIQKKYKNDPQKMNEETMKLYKEYSVNPFGGCLPLLIQFPILLAYIRVVRDPVKYVFGSKNLFDSVHKGFLWILDISKTPTAVIGNRTNDIEIAGIVIPVIAILSAVTTFIYSKYTMNQQVSSVESNNPAQGTQKAMTYTMPIMFLFFGYTYPVGFTIYWTVSNIFSIVQQVFIRKMTNKNKVTNEVPVKTKKLNKKK